MLHDGKFRVKLGLPDGNAFPTTPAPERGDIFYRADEDKIYRFNGATWVHIGAGILAADVVNTPAGGIAATDVQAAIDELDAEKAAATQQAWQEVAAGVGFQNAWVDMGGGDETAAYFKDSLGIVHLKGLVKDGVVGLAIFTLPAGYRPVKHNFFVVASNNAYGDCYITSAGVVQSITGNNTWFSLAGITFRAA